MRIFVGSDNKFKIAAVESAAEDIFREKIQVIGRKVASDINEQPVGDTETIEGAMNRLATLKNLVGDFKHDLLVTIENGIRPVEINPSSVANGRVGLRKYWYDLAWVVAEYEGKQELAHSAGIRIDTGFVEKVRAKGFDRHHIGMEMQERWGSNAIDPHSYLTNGIVVRADMINQAAKIAIARLFNTKIKS